MSVDHMSMVFEAEGLSVTQKALLLAYANRTDAHGYTYPGVERLAAETGMSQSTVIRTRKGLEARNLLRHQRRVKPSGRSTSNMYRINLDKLRSMRRAPKDFGDDSMALEFDDEFGDASTALDQAKKSGSDQPTCHSDTLGGSTVTPSPCHSDTLGGGTVTPNPSEEPSDDPSVRSARESAATERGSIDGRTDDAPSITEEHRATARELAQHADLAKVGARQSQVPQVADALAAALALGYSADQLRAHLRAKLNEARTVRYVLNALDPTRLADIQPHTPAPSLLPVCGECEARDGDGIVERVVVVEDADGATRAGKCPRCHPYAKTAHNGR